MKLNILVGAVFAMLSMTAPGVFASPADGDDAKQVLEIDATGNVNLKKSDVCFSETGLTFARISGMACRTGDLAYINVAFDSTEAGDLADRYCDFKKQRPPEAMDVYGVLCYLRVAPAAVAKRSNK